MNIYFCQYYYNYHYLDQYIGKNNKKKRIFKYHFLKNRMPNLAQVAYAFLFKAGLS